MSVLLFFLLLWLAVVTSTFLEAIVAWAHTRRCLSRSSQEYLFDPLLFWRRVLGTRGFYAPEMRFDFHIRCRRRHTQAEAPARRPLELVRHRRLWLTKGKLLVVLTTTESEGRCLFKKHCCPSVSSQPAVGIDAIAEVSR